MASAAAIGSVGVGRYRLDVGGAAGTLIAPSPTPPEGDDPSLARALKQEPRTAGEPTDAMVDSAPEVTTRAEQAVALAKGLAAGRIDPRNVSGHVDLMLEMLERPDGQGRWEERRLARELNSLLALLFRWVDLVRSLKVLRAGAERFGDRSTVAWSEHDLGTLHLAAGDLGGANRRLEEAERIRREIRDRAGLAATQQTCRCSARSYVRSSASMRGDGAPAARAARGSGPPDSSLLGGCPRNLPAKMRAAQLRGSSFGPQTAANWRHFEDEHAQRAAQKTGRLQAIGAACRQACAACHAEGRGFESLQPLSERPAFAGLIRGRSRLVRCVAWHPMGTRRPTRGGSA
jgi:mono/diheme cytochrome c family protein